MDSPDVPGTVFYLTAQNECALQIIQDRANFARSCIITRSSTQFSALRIGLDQNFKCPSCLVRFGRRQETNDIILSGPEFNEYDQCYFDFHEDSGELLLHDISINSDTKLCKIVVVAGLHGPTEECGDPQLRKTPRQCVVLLNGRVWCFHVGPAKFRLFPPTFGTNSVQEKLQFTGKHVSPPGIDPDADQTVGMAMAQVQRLAMTHNTANHPDTRLRTPSEPDRGETIEYTQLEQLGEGYQGVVHRVVNNYTGALYACKVITVKNEVNDIPEWNIHSEQAFRARVHYEITLVQGLRHNHIVPYIHSQEVARINSSPIIEIFMPVYEGNLHSFLQPRRRDAPKCVPDIIDSMVRQILGALQYVHSQNPRIIHRDVKPQNILYRGDQFFLADFGIAKCVNKTRTVIGTELFMAPEVQWERTHTTKIDIWGVGVTVVECYTSLDDLYRVYGTWDDLRRNLRDILLDHTRERFPPRFADMLTLEARRRPTASELLKKLNERNRGHEHRYETRNRGMHLLDPQG